MAAHFDTTPSELAILNRLPSRTVFPGQIIRVPDKSKILTKDGSTTDHESGDYQDSNDSEKHDGGESEKGGDEKSDVCDEEMGE